MDFLLEQYQQELNEAKQEQKRLIKAGLFGAPLKLQNAKIAMLLNFVNDLTKAISNN